MRRVGSTTGLSEGSRDGSQGAWGSVRGSQRAAAAVRYGSTQTTDTGSPAPLVRNGKGSAYGGFPGDDEDQDVRASGELDLHHDEAAEGAIGRLQRPEHTTGDEHVPVEQRPKESRGWGIFSWLGGGSSARAPSGAPTAAAPTTGSIGSTVDTETVVRPSVIAMETIEPLHAIADSPDTTSASLSSGNVADSTARSRRAAWMQLAKS